MSVQKSVQKLDETFEWKEKRVDFASGEHPLELHFQGDNDIRANVIYNHPEVEGFAYVYEDTLTKDFLVTRIIDFKKSLCNQVVAVKGDFSKFVPFVLNESVLFSKSLHYNNGELDDCIPSEKVETCLTNNKGKYSPPPSVFNKLGNLRIVSISYVIPLIKGMNITEGSIEGSVVVGKLVAYHCAATEWLCLMNMESCCNSKLWCGEDDNQCSRLVDNKNIVLSYNGELFIKVLTGTSKNSVAYQTVKNLVNNFKTQELVKYRLGHPEEKEAIPKSIVLDCNPRSSASASTKSSDKTSSSDEVKVVNTNGNILSFFRILFCGEGSGDKMIPAKISDEAMKIIGSSENIAEQVRLTADNITAKVNGIGTERSYLSRYTRFPFLFRTLISYMLQSHLHNGVINSNLESLKKLLVF